MFFKISSFDELCVFHSILFFPVAQCIQPKNRCGHINVGLIVAEFFDFQIHYKILN